MKQAEYCIRMALEIAPFHIKNYMTEILIDIKILSDEYQAALSLIDQLTKSKFAVERQKPKRLYCLKKMGLSK